MNVRRRRGLLLLALALASGGLAASQVHRREQSVEAQVGPLIPVLVAARDIPAGSRIPSGALDQRRVPARFVPPDAMADTAGVAGARTAAGLAAGSYVTAGHLSGQGAAAAGPGGRATGALRDGERALEIAVGGGAALARASPGARVDVVVSTERADGAGRSFVALEDVELLGLRPADGSSGLEAGEDEAGPGGLPGAGALGATGAEGDGSAASAALVATLRVSLRQAVYLTAAENFGREVRLLVRPPGDRSRTGGAAVGEDEL